MQVCVSINLVPKLFKLLRLNQRGVVHLIPLLLMLAGIIVGVYLVQKQGFQIFKPKASSHNVEFLPGECVFSKDGKPALKCPNVNIKFTSPVDSDQRSDGAFQLIKTAYAADFIDNAVCLDTEEYESSKIYNKQTKLEIATCGNGQKCNLQINPLGAYCEDANGPAIEGNDWYCGTGSLVGGPKNKMYRSMSWGLDWFAPDPSISCSAGKECRKDRNKVFCASPSSNNDLTVVSPKGTIDANAKNFNFKWSGMPSGIEGYRLVIDSSDGRQASKQGEGYTSGCPTNYQNHFYCVGHNKETKEMQVSLSPLFTNKAGVTYTWWVEALNGIGGKISESPHLQFEVINSAQVQKEPLKCTDITFKNDPQRDVVSNKEIEIPAGSKSSEISYYVNRKQESSDPKVVIKTNGGTLERQQSGYYSWIAPEKEGSYQVWYEFDGVKQDKCQVTFKVVKKQESQKKPICDSLTFSKFNSDNSETIIKSNVTDGNVEVPNAKIRIKANILDDDNNRDSKRFRWDEGSGGGIGDVLDPVFSDRSYIGKTYKLSFEIYDVKQPKCEVLVKIIEDNAGEKLPPSPPRTGGQTTAPRCTTPTPCIYSENDGNGVKCYSGKCSDGTTTCGLNNGCVWVAGCTKEVACSAGGEESSDAAPVPESAVPAERREGLVIDTSCEDNPPVGAGIGERPEGYTWKSDCNKVCSVNADCPVNDFDPDNVNSKSSNWCYGFASGPRCLMLVKTGGLQERPIGVTTRFRFAEDLALLKEAQWRNYTALGVTVPHTFEDKTLDNKPRFIYAEFEVVTKDAQGKIIRTEVVQANPYPASITLFKEEIAAPVGNINVGQQDEYFEP